MKIKFSEIEDAFEFVGCAGLEEHTALLDKKDGKIYFRSEYSDFDEIPDEIFEADSVVEIPHRKSLDLGTRLVFRFVDEMMPDEYDTVHKIFNRRSAYAYYKDLLVEKEMLDSWYAYENAATRKAVREWCTDEEIELTD